MRFSTFNKLKGIVNPLGIPLRQGNLVSSVEHRAKAGDLMNRVKESVISALKLLLPARIKNSLLHVSYHLAPTAFERFAHIYCVSPSMAAGLQSLAHRG